MELKGFIVFTLLAIIVQTTLGLSCRRSGACKCTMSDNSGEINLRSVGLQNGSAKFVVNRPWSWSFKYNPCYELSSVFSNLAILQYGTHEQFNLGIQPSENFVYDPSSGVSIKYEDNITSPFRNSSVLLVCERYSLKHKLRFVGELKVAEYEFILTGPCACPGGCNDNGIIPTEIPTFSPETAPNNRRLTAKSTLQYWGRVGSEMLGLVFHDLLIVIVVVCIVVVAKNVFGYGWSICKPKEIVHEKLVAVEM